MKLGIKAKDIRDFEKYVKKLDEVIKRIKEYKEDAYIYATPDYLNLMAYFVDNSRSIRVSVDPLVVSAPLTSLDSGDW